LAIFGVAESLAGRPRPRRFPYPRLFRSPTRRAAVALGLPSPTSITAIVSAAAYASRSRRRASISARPASSGLVSPSRYCTTAARSEEHTSELQSRVNLVCRLLLEKKQHT